MIAHNLGLPHALAGDFRRASECFHFLFSSQAEDGIRDWSVTGVQTCALPISSRRRHTRLVSDWSSDVCSSDLKYASGASSPTHEAYFIKISLTVFSSPRRSMSSRNTLTLRGGTHQASSEVSTSFLFSSGTCSQNSWSSSSVYDCTERPACDIISSCVERILRSASISVFMRSSSCFTAFTRNSPFS